MIYKTILKNITCSFSSLFNEITSYTFLGDTTDANKWS